MDQREEKKFTEKYSNFSNPNFQNMLFIIKAPLLRLQYRTAI